MEVLEKSFNNPLYREKLQDIPQEVMRQWVETRNNDIVKIPARIGRVRRKWFTIHEDSWNFGMFGGQRGKDVKDLRELHAEGWNAKVQWI